MSVMTVQEAVDLIESEKIFPHGLAGSFVDYDCELCKAWQTLKAAVLAQQTTNKQSVPFVECDKCGEIADYHFCSECLESYTN